MFRLFLRKKILSGTDAPAKAVPERDEWQKRNRRGFTRYIVDHKHLTLMNEQDILLVREISAKGLSVELSQRGFERLLVGDVYDARMRYLGEIHDLQARVTWKHERFVGFEIVNATRETLLFIKRLLKPIEIAASLQPVEASFLKEESTGKSWFHGEDESDLYIWHDPATGRLTSWQLSVGENYVEWHEADGFKTGKVVPHVGQQVLLGANLPGLSYQADPKADLTKWQFAADLIMALGIEDRDDLMTTLTEGDLMVRGDKTQVPGGF